MEYKKVPSDGAATREMIEAAMNAWDTVMLGPPSQQLGGPALIVLFIMTAYRDMIDACPDFDAWPKQ